MRFTSFIFLLILKNKIYIKFIYFFFVISIKHKRIDIKIIILYQHFLKIINKNSQFFKIIYQNLFFLSHQN